MNLRTVYGNMRGARSGDTCAVTNEVVAAVAVEGHGSIVDGNYAVAIDIYAAEVIGLRIHSQTIDRGIGHSTCQHSRRNGLLGHILAIGNHNGVCHLKMVYLAVVLIVHLHSVGYGQHHIAGIGAGLDLAVDAVNGQGQALARRGRKDSLGGDGQRSKLLRCLGHIAAADDFFVHRKLSFWRWAPGLDIGHCPVPVPPQYL